MELVIHRDKLESSTEREKKEMEEGVEQKGDKCLEEKENQDRWKKRCVGMLKTKRIGWVKRWKTPQKKKKE